MAALRLLLLLLLLLPPPALPDRPAPACRLQWVQVGSGAGGCRGGGAAACVGHCESGAFPSPHAIMAASRHPRTSLAQCCTIARAHKVWVTLHCPGGPRRLPTVSARACRCDMCRLSRY
ncbi:glycoprotein hormone alpha-2 [Grus americana]|uniref:glycoprotein hormone alpha-2 n=1 Tax=Grus americana TaxID=9117 RepID=UPI00240784CD|nr:glycoprotein hormone alpha-2 [Grus americana]